MKGPLKPLNSGESFAGSFDFRGSARLERRRGPFCTFAIISWLRLSYHGIYFLAQPRYHSLHLLIVNIN